MNVIFKIILLSLFSLNVFAKEIPLPKDINKYFAEPHILGNYRLHYFGFNLYDIQLIIEKKDLNSSNREKSAIHVRYNRDVAKEDLMDSTFEEVAQVAGVDEEFVVKNYNELLNEIYSEIQKGDQKLAIRNGSNFKFFYNDKLVKDFDDEFFAKNFVGMWLNEKTSRKKMRQNLLNLDE